MSKRKPFAPVQTPAPDEGELSRAVEALNTQLTPDFDREAATLAGLAVKHWRAFRGGEPGAGRDFALRCQQLGTDAVAAQALVLQAFMAGRADGSHVAGKLIPAMHSKNARKVKPAAAEYKDAALRAWDALPKRDRRKLSTAYKLIIATDEIQKIKGERKADPFTAQTLGDWLAETGRRPRPTRSKK